MFALFKTSVLLSVLSVAPTACSGPPSSATTPPTTRTANTPSNSPTSAAAPNAKTESNNPVGHCVELVAEGGGFDILSGCIADLHSHKPCGDAWRIFQGGGQLDATSVEHILRACGPHYCPLLQAPKPKLCTAGVDTGAGAFGINFADFVAQILALETNLVGTPSLWASVGSILGVNQREASRL